MIKIIPATDFKTLPWKNGKGETIELAINEGATLDNFDWRLSIASVTENGIFSDFGGYQRNLILIKGAGIELHHDDKYSDKLDHLLDFATFDGGNKTNGQLPNGPIKDFNIITKATRYQPIVDTYVDETSITVNHSGLCFIYSLSADVTVKDRLNDSSIQLPKGDLLFVDQQADFSINGQEMIIVRLTAI